MPFAHTIDPRRGVMWLRLWGEFTMADAERGRLAVQQDPALRPDLSQFVDCTGVTSVALGGRDVQTLAMRPRMVAGRCVVLASGEVTFGLGRMFAAYRACDHETWLAVTRDRAEALAWLGLQPDAQPPAAGWVGDE